jgi:hypothetical protein
LADLELNPIVIVLEVLDGDRPCLALDADLQGRAVQLIRKALIRTLVESTARVSRAADQPDVLTARILIDYCPGFL